MIPQITQQTQPQTRPSSKYSSSNSSSSKDHQTTFISSPTQMKKTNPNITITNEYNTNASYTMTLDSPVVQ